jgi:hypothetical protein
MVDKCDATIQEKLRDAIVEQAAWLLTEESSIFPTGQQ